MLASHPGSFQAPVDLLEYKLLNLVQSDGNQTGLKLCAAWV